MFTDSLTILCDGGEAGKRQPGVRGAAAWCSGGREQDEKQSGCVHSSLAIPSVYAPDCPVVSDVDWSLDRLVGEVQLLAGHAQRLNHFMLRLETALFEVLLLQSAAVMPIASNTEAARLRRPNHQTMGLEFPALPGCAPVPGSGQWRCCAQ